MQIWIMCVSCKRPKKKALKGCSISNGVAAESISTLRSGAFFFHWLIPRIGWSSGRLSPARSQTLKRLRKTWLGTFGGLLFVVIKALGKSVMKLLGYFFQFVSTRERNSNANISFTKIITNNHQQAPTITNNTNIDNIVIS